MVIKQEVAFGIVRGLTEFWKSEEFQDFTVSIGSSQFRCHRLVLATCSDFFRALFRSKMKETEQKCVSIQDITSETFELILESVYTGRDVLNKENIIDIWRASQQLQIHFLVSECENFVIQNIALENYVEYLQTSKALDSKSALKNVWSFVRKNANSFFQTNYFLELSFAEVLDLVKCQDLEINSEDDVIQAILKWAVIQNVQTKFHFSKKKDETTFIQEDENNSAHSEISSEQNQNMNNSNENLTFFINADENNKKEYCVNQGEATSKDSIDTYLTQLLSHARTCLASRVCLKMLSEHPLTRDNKDIKDIVIDSLLNHIQVGSLDDQWTAKAVHRNNSNLTNCLVEAKHSPYSAVINAYSFQKKKWFKIPGIENVKNIKLVAAGTKLFALCHSRYYWDIHIYQLEKGAWSELNISQTIQTDRFSIAAVESFLFIYPADKRILFKFDSTSQTLTEITDSPVCIEFSYILPYKQYILVIFASNVKDVEETDVHCYDTCLKTWKQLNNIEGPAKGIISFKDDHFTFILQPNGNLWKVVSPQSNIIDFEFVAKLWSCSLTMYGAATYIDELYIHCDYKAQEPPLPSSLPGVFIKINYIESSEKYPYTIMSIPFTLETKKLA